MPIIIGVTVASASIDASGDRRAGKRIRRWVAAATPRRQARLK
jgi:hypothetical protein